jgi:DNA repair protein RadC
MSYFIPRFEVKLVREGSLKSELKYFEKSTDAYEVLRPLFEDLDREKMGVLFLDNKHKLIGFQFVAIVRIPGQVVH